VHIVEAELLDQLLAPDDLLVSLRAPAEQGEVVDEGVGQVAPVAIGLEGDGIPALRASYAAR